MIAQQKQLLKRVKVIVKHNKELALAKGEVFNIYNILNLKTKEVRTHSAFIAELLNPKGTHFLGTLFLDAFITLLPKEVFQDFSDIKTITTEVEFFIGPINPTAKTGGRIDILLKDSFNNTICIENKIDAGDQDDQIERYFNYNKAKNKVVYLTRYGEEPDVTSKGSLISDSDFYCISYQNHIINWLEKCQSIASDHPILRESIKQYKILIQQITKTLGNQQDKELKEAVIANLDEASLIASKYNLVVTDIKEEFRNTVVTLLKTHFSNYSIDVRRNIDKSYASIWFHNDISNQTETWFGAESFSGSGYSNGVLFVGLYNKTGTLNLDDSYNMLSKSWLHHEVLKYDNKEINLSDSAFLQTISTKQKLDEVAKNVSAQIISFIDKNEHLIKA